MADWLDKVDMKKVKKDTDEFVFEISKDFLDAMNWNDSKLDDKISVKEAMQMFAYIMANLMLTINTDWETFLAGIGTLAGRTNSLEYESTKNLYFVMSMLKFGSNWRDVYKQYSEEFDELNKNEKAGENASVEVETETENKEDK